MKEKLVKFVKENGFLLFLFICVGVVAFSTIYVVTQEVDPKGGELLTKEQIKDLPKELNKKDTSKNTSKKEVTEKEVPKKEIPKKEVPKVEAPKEKSKQEEDKLNKEKEESKPIQQVKEQKVEIAMMVTPDGNSRIELSKFISPPTISDHRTASVNSLGYLRVMFTVEDVDEMVARHTKHGAQLVGEVVQYENAYRLCYIRGTEGLLIGLAEEIGAKRYEVGNKR